MKHRATRRAAALGVFVAAALTSASACQIVENNETTVAGPPGQPVGAVGLRENVRVLTDAEAEAVEVEPDRLLVPADAAWAKNLPPGTVLASGVGDGFLRRVLSSSNVKVQGVGVRGISGDALQFLTELVGLEDAIMSGAFHQEIALDPIEQDLSSKLGTQRFTSFVVSLSPTVTLDARFGRGQLDTLRFAVESDNRLVAKMKLSAADKADVDLLVSPWVRVRFSVGALPVVLNVRLALNGGYDLAASQRPFNLGFTCSQKASLALEYAGGAFVEPTWNAPWSCTFDEPRVDVVTTLKSDVYIRPTVEVRLYGKEKSPGLHARLRAGIAQTAEFKSQPVLACPFKATFTQKAYVAAELSCEARLFGKTLHAELVNEEVFSRPQGGTWPTKPECQSAPTCGSCIQAAEATTCAAEKAAFLAFPGALPLANCKENCNDAACLASCDGICAPNCAEAQRLYLAYLTCVGGQCCPLCGSLCGTPKW